MPSSTKSDIIYNPYNPITFAGVRRRCFNPQMNEEARQKATTTTPDISGQKREREDHHDNDHTVNTSSSRPSTTLTVSSETKLDDILKERTRQAAAMGVTRAIDMTKEEAAMKHKERLYMSSSSSLFSNTDGGTTTSRIADQVLKLKTSTVGVNLQTGEAMLGGGGAKTLPPSFNGGDDDSSTTSSSSTLPPPTKLLETHLEFQRGKDGRHVIAAAAPPSGGAAVAPQATVYGKPTSTLIIRNLILRDVFYGRYSPTTTTTTETTPNMPVPTTLEQQARAATSFTGRIIAEVSAECGKCGHVKEVAVCDMFQSPTPSSNDTNNEQSGSSSSAYPSMPMLAPSSSSLSSTGSGVPLVDPTSSVQSFKSQRDAIVVWVRMDTVVSGFKAAGRINGKVFLGDASRLAVVGFYPSSSFDQGVRTTNNAILNNNANTSRVVVVEALEKLLPAEYLNR